MGQKVNPDVYRGGLYSSSWFLKGEEYCNGVFEDYIIRDFIMKEGRDACIINIYIEKVLNTILIYIVCLRPSFIIGKNGEKINKITLFIEKKFNKNVFIDIKEEQNKKNNVSLIAENIARQIESKKPYRKVIKQTINNVMSSMPAGCGIMVMISGRLNGVEIARKERFIQGRVPLGRIRANIDFCFVAAHTCYGLIGIKVFLYKGEMLDSKKLPFISFESKKNYNQKKSRSKDYINYNNNKKKYVTT